MSDTDTPSEVAVASDGITVRKATASDEFPVPAVTFDFISERDDAAVVRLVDAAPDDVALDDIGFNPDYGGDHWSIEDGYAVFERRLAPGEEYQTVYGVRNADLDPEQFVIDPVLDVTSVGTPDVDDDTEPSEKAATATPTGANGVGAALAAELRNDDLSSADRELIAEAFGRQDSEAVRLSHLQARISDLEAYTDALEAFIDDHGTGHEAVEDLSDRLDTIETEIADLTDRTDENTTEIETVTERTEANATEIESVADRADGNAAGIDEIDERLDKTATDVDELADRADGNAAGIDEIDERLDKTATDVDELADRADGNAAGIDEIDERLDKTATDVDELADRTDENATDIDALDKGVADVQAEIEETQAWIDDLREEIEEIDAWRGRISNVFGEESVTEGEEESED